MKARFSGDDAGAYAAASAFARVGFFLPATILAVLFPRTAARQARGEETEDILGRSLLATALFCGAARARLCGRRRRARHDDFRARLRGGRHRARSVRAGDRALLARERPRRLPPLARRDALRLDRRRRRRRPGHRTRRRSRRACTASSGRTSSSALRCSPRTSSSSARACRRCAPASGASTRRRGTCAPRRDRGGGRPRSAPPPFVCALMWPVVRHIGSTDRRLAWVATRRDRLRSSGHCSTRAATTCSATRITRFSGAPFGWDEGNGLNVQWLLPYYPAYLATKLFGEVAAYNLVTLAGYVLSGASMYAARALPALQPRSCPSGPRSSSSSSPGTSPEPSTRRSCTSRCSRCSCSRSSPSHDGADRGCGSGSSALRRSRAG